MIDHAERLGDVGRRLQLDAMSLAVIETQRVTSKSLIARDRQSGCGLDPAGEKYNRLWRDVCLVDRS